MLRKGAEFVWEDACERAFQELKGELLKKPILVSFKSGLETKSHKFHSGDELQSNSGDREDNDFGLGNALDESIGEV